MRKLYFDLDPRPINRPVQYLRLELISARMLAWET